jgi:CO/xanthine dehydrogenase Mo-binding subunit
MNAPEQLARRRFLQLSGAAGGLLLFFGSGGEVAAAPAQPAAAAAAAAPLLNSWIRIAPDGSVALYSNISELGQGTGSALAQLIAEELEVPWQSIRIEMAPIAKASHHTGQLLYRQQPGRVSPIRQPAQGWRDRAHDAGAGRQRALAG